MNARWAPRRSHRAHYEVERPSKAFAPMALLLACCLLGGGASRLNTVNTLVLEVIAAMAAAWAIHRLTRIRGWRQIILPLLFMAAAAAAPLIQLMPLPPDLWASLPGHKPAAEALQLAGVAERWRPMSLMPGETLNSLLALVPPFVVFLLGVMLNDTERERIIWLILSAGLLCIALGLGQLTGGADSRAYLYNVANPGGVSGLFANRNHYAVLLVCLLPFAAVSAGKIGGDTQDERFLLVAIGALLIYLLVIIGVVMGRSRAGVLLLAPSIISSLLIALRHRAQGPISTPVLLIGGVVTVAILVAAAFGLGPVLARFSEDQASDIRFAALPTGWSAALDHLPFGSGLGTFEYVYRSVEPVELMGPAFLNHAHNEYMELWLEAGLLAAIPLAAFLVWWIAKSWTSWFGPAARRNTLAMSGAVVSGILLLHSVVDYPLRTIALASVFAFALSLLVPTVRRQERRPSEDRALTQTNGPV